MVGVLAAGIYALPSLWYPFGFDQPIHWYIGRRLLEGEIPYAESGISTKPPGPFLVYAASQLLMGDGLWAIRVTDLAFAFATAALVVTFRKRRTQPDGRIAYTSPILPGELGAACVLVLGFYYTYFGFSDTAHPELWQAFFMLASGWVIVRAPDGRVSGRRALLAGVLACVAVCFKHVAAVTGVLGGIAVLAMPLAHRDPKAALRNGALYTLGVAIVLAALFLPFVLTGTFDSFWELMVEYLLVYAAKGAPPSYGIPRWLTPPYALYGVATCVFAWVLGLSVAHAARDRRELRAGIWIGALLLGAFGSVFVQRRVFSGWNFTYHFIATVPFLALAMAWGLRRALPRLGRTQLAIAGLLLASAFWFAPEWTFGGRAGDWSYRKEWPSFWAYVHGERSFEAFHAPHECGRIESHLRLTIVAREIRERARPGDTLCVDGYTAHLYQMTGLRCPSRFLIGDGVGDIPEWHAEYRRMLDETPPTFFVTFPDRSRARELVARGYERSDIRTDGMTYVLLERRQPAAPPGD